MRSGVISGLLGLLVALSAAAASAVDPSPVLPEMKPVGIDTLKPGTSAPEFTLTDTNGDKHVLSAYTKAGNIVVLEWFDPQCPEVAKYRADSSFMNDTARAFRNRKVVWLAIDSNAVSAQGETDTAAISKFAKDHDMAVPVLLDREGAVGRAYGVKATPTVFVLDSKGSIAYSGAPDASVALDRKPSGTNYVKDAIAAALAGNAPAVNQTVAYGCNIDYAAPKVAAPMLLQPSTLPPVRPMPLPRAEQQP